MTKLMERVNNVPNVCWNAICVGIPTFWVYYDFKVLSVPHVLKPDSFQTVFTSLPQECNVILACAGGLDSTFCFMYSTFKVRIFWSNHTLTTERSLESFWYTSVHEFSAKVSSANRNNPPEIFSLPKSLIKI